MKLTLRKANYSMAEVKQPPSPLAQSFVPLTKDGHQVSMDESKSTYTLEQVPTDGGLKAWTTVTGAYVTMHFLT